MMLRRDRGARRATLLLALLLPGAARALERDVATPAPAARSTLEVSAPAQRASAPKRRVVKAARATPSAKRSAGTVKRRATSTTRRRTRGARPARRAAPLPALVATAPRGASALASDLSALMRARTTSGQWGALVVSLTRGDTLFSEAAASPVTPASTMKLFTAALAFERLGPDHTFSTDILRDGTIAPDGTLRGNLYIRGDGDPGFSDRFIRGGVNAPVEVLAGMIAANGVKRITGDVVGDASAFEARRIPDGWHARNLGTYYAAPFSALSLNENLLVVAVAPGQSGQRATVRLEPASLGVRLTGS
ncbi:MAG: D-alanyl-D-alanine carboxypeptidase, partial [Gemmatimonadaceae bacterium]|nr:D-alanyl-D-alanine carboxypeptidase [Gemmatimonadaceae bacterium]